MNILSTVGLSEHFAGVHALDKIDISEGALSKRSLCMSNLIKKGGLTMIRSLLPILNH